MDLQKPDVKKLYPIWGAMCGSIITFMIISRIVEVDVDPTQAEEVLPMLGGIFGALSLSMVVGSFLMRNIIYFKRRDALEASERQGVYATAGIVSWAMAEAIGLFGFVLHMLTGHPYIIFPFAALSLTLLFALIPRASDLTP